MAPLDEVANEEKMMPRDYITADGFRITAKAPRATSSPLIRGEDYPPYRDGLPQYVTLKNAPVTKKLAEALCAYSSAPFSSRPTSPIYDEARLIAERGGS